MQIFFYLPFYPPSGGHCFKEGIYPLHQCSCTTHLIGAQV